MIERAMCWTLAVALLLPTMLAGQQQDPALVGEGAQVYSANCARCHNARSSMERSDAQWAVIVAQMRVRANMTKAQAEAVLAYLQATNMPEGGSMGGHGDGDRQPPEQVVLPPELRMDLLLLLAPDPVREGVRRVRSQPEADPAR